MGYALSVILTSQVWAFSLLFDVFFERRYTGKKFYALLALWMAVIIVEANILQNRIGALLFLCEIAAFYLMNVTLYKGSWDRRIFVTVTQYAGFFNFLPHTAAVCICYVHFMGRTGEPKSFVHWRAVHNPH